MRAAVVTAAAISEAQNDILAKFDRFVFVICVQSSLISGQFLRGGRNCLYLKYLLIFHYSSMEEGRGRKGVGPGQGRGRGKYKSMLNDGVKLPRSVKVGPGGAGSRKNNKVQVTFSFSKTLIVIFSPSDCQP